MLDRRPRTHDAHLFAYSAGMAPEVSGRIVALHVTNNQRVKRGEPLVDIDPEPFELRVRQARAQVAALKAQINLTGRQVASQRSGARSCESIACSGSRSGARRAGWSGGNRCWGKVM